MAERIDLTFVQSARKTGEIGLKIYSTYGRTSDDTRGAVVISIRYDTPGSVVTN